MALFAPPDGIGAEGVVVADGEPPVGATVAIGVVIVPFWYGAFPIAEELGAAEPLDGQLTEELE